MDFSRGTYISLQNPRLPETQYQQQVYALYTNLSMAFMHIALRMRSIHATNGTALTNGHSPSFDAHDVEGGCPLFPCRLVLFQGVDYLINSRSCQRAAWLLSNGELALTNLPGATGAPSHLSDCIHQESSSCAASLGLTLTHVR